jgi:formylglycine-generating enzyme required for sulfatase activity
VSWNDASEFCWWMSEQEGQEYRLPTEAEWEYACRAGTSARYYFGDDPAALGEYAWYGANAENRTQPVGKKMPNAFGLNDMHGNVWEWCSDWYDARYYKHAPMDNPAGPAASAGRVIRGGAWHSLARLVRAAYRNGVGPAARNVNLGFRCGEFPSGR